MPNVKKINLPWMTALSLTWFTDSSIQRHWTNERNTLAHTMSISVNPCFITLQWRQLTSALCKWNKCTTSNNISFSHLLFYLEPSIKWLNDLDRIFLHCVKQSRNKPATVSSRGRAWCTGNATSWQVACSGAMPTCLPTVPVLRYTDHDSQDTHPFCE